MNLVFGHDATVAAWIEKQTGWLVDKSPAVVAGVIDGDGVLRGAFVLTWATDTTAEMHLVGRTSNDVWKRWFRYVFDVSGIYRLEIRTSRRNKAIKRSAPKFGFVFEGVSKGFYGPGDDALVYRMTPDLCRWIHGQPPQVAETANAG